MAGAAVVDEAITSTMLNGAVLTYQVPSGTSRYLAELTVTNGAGLKTRWSCRIGSRSTKRAEQR